MKNYVKLLIIILCLMYTAPAVASVTPDRHIQAELNNLFINPPLVSGYPFQDELAQAAARYGLPLPMVLAVARGESFFNPSAISHKGAVGIMQVMPSTAAEFGVTREELFDPRVNIDTGVRYLAERYQGFNDPYLALGAYYCGPGGINRTNSTLRGDCDEYVRYIHNHLQTIVAGSQGNYALAAAESTEMGSAGGFALAWFDNFLDARRFQDMVGRILPGLSLDLFREEKTHQDHVRYEYHVLVAGSAKSVCSDLETETGFSFCLEN